MCVHNKMLNFQSVGQQDTTTNTADEVVNTPPSSLGTEFNSIYQESSLHICLQHHREADRGLNNNKLNSQPRFLSWGLCFSNAEQTIGYLPKEYFSHSEIIWSERGVLSYEVLSQRSLTHAPPHGKWYQVLGGRPWVAAPSDNGC